MLKNAYYTRINLMYRLQKHVLGIVFGCFSCFVLAGHPTDGGLVEMAHPTEPLAENVLVPSVSFSVSADSMDGYNLILHLHNFHVTVPLDGAEDIISTANGFVMSGHLHLYLNGKKMMRVYGNAVHVPKSWVDDGINTITLSINNHQHGTFTYQDNEVQSTIIFDAREQDNLVKSVYSWPRF